MDKEVLTDVMNSVDDAMDSVEFALSRIDECKLCKYDYSMTKDCLSKVVRILDIVYDIMELAGDKE